MEKKIQRSSGFGEPWIRQGYFCYIHTIFRFYPTGISANVRSVLRVAPLRVLPLPSLFVLRQLYTKVIRYEYIEYMPGCPLALVTSLVTPVRGVVT